MNIKQRIIHLQTAFGFKRDLTDTDKILRYMDRNRAAFKSAESGRLNANWSAKLEDINLVLWRELDTMRARSRWLMRNNPYASSVINLLRNYVVGTGFDLQMASVRTSRDESTGQLVTEERTNFNDFVQDLFGDWAENVHAAASDSSPDSFKDIQEIMLERWIEDGEVLIEYRVNKSRDIVPFELEFIDPDNLDTFRTSNNGNPCVLGVEIDQTSFKPLAYWVFDHGANPLYSETTKSRRVDAANVIHLFRKRYPKQLRGIPFVSQVAQKFFDVEDYSNAQLIRNKIAAFFGVLLKGIGGDAMGFDDGTTQTGDDGGKWIRDSNNNKIVALSPGMVGGLPEGVEPEMINPTSPEATYGPFIESQLQAIGAGIDYGVSYVGLTRDTSKTTFAGGRQAENMDFQGYRPLQRKFARRGLSSIFNAWFDVGVLSGAIIAPGYFEPLPGKKFFRRHNWMPGGWSRGVNPLQEVNASIKSMEAGITTLEDEASYLGLDWKTQLRKQKKIADFKASLGLTDPNVEGETLEQKDAADQELQEQITGAT